MPAGYKLIDSKIGGGYKYEIQTPSDTIYLRDIDENSSCVLTSGISNQDKLNVANHPNILNDELSKMKRAFVNDKELTNRISVQIHASKADIGL